MTKRHYTKADKTKNVAMSVITCILVILVILFIVGACVFYYRSSQVIVTFEGEEYNSDIDTVLNLERDTMYRFDVNKSKGYKIYVIQSMSDDNDNFMYYVNEQMTAIKYETDVSAGFDIVKDDKGFNLSITKGMDGILKAIHEVDIELEDREYQGQYFALYVTDNKGGNGCKINFRSNLNLAVKSVELDKGGLIL